MTEGEAAPELDPLLQRLRAALVYGVLTFAAGFLFGLLRELALIPWFGAQAGRWIEFIAMIAMCFVTASFALRQLQQRDRAGLTFTGLGGVAVLLACESLFALYVVEVPLAQYLRGFDVMRGELFVWGLLAMTLAPVIMGRKR